MPPAECSGPLLRDLVTYIDYCSVYQISLAVLQHKEAEHSQFEHCTNSYPVCRYLGIMAGTKMAAYPISVGQSLAIVIHVQ